MERQPNNLNRNFAGGDNKYYKTPKLKNTLMKVALLEN
tara:strand:- start:1939 stop:2052 length:114 start_codon:yes stop_codon:yes gene_type:complete